MLYPSNRWARFGAGLSTEYSISLMMLVLILSCTMATLWGDSPVGVNTHFHTFSTHYATYVVQQFLVITRDEPPNTCHLLVTCCHKRVSTTVTHAHDTMTCIHTINVFCCLNMLPPAFSDTLQPLHKPMENSQALVLHNM